MRIGLGAELAELAELSPASAVVAGGISSQAGLASIRPLLVDA